MTEAPVCAGCDNQRSIPPPAPAPAGHTAWHRECAELRSSGARFAREMEHQPFVEFLRKWRNAEHGA